MKGLLIATAFGLGLLGAAISTTGTANASGAGDRHSHGGTSTGNPFGPWVFGPSHHQYNQDYRHHGRQQAQWRGQKKGHKVVIQQHKYPQYRSYAQVVRPCQQTSGIGYDGRGRRARFGGVMCYDTYGAPYIVQGSSFIIHYF